MAEDTKRTPEEHISYLAKEIFQVEERWPQYRLNLEDMRVLHAEYKEKKVLSLERSILGQCGNATGESRWLPLFDHLTVINHGLADSRIDYAVGPDALQPWDLIVVPNLLHHVRDQGGFFRVLRQLASQKPGCEIYIFDTTIHELHDVPHDYIRYTPYGIQDILERNGFDVMELNETGNHMAALWYFLDFAEHQYSRSESLVTQKVMGRIKSEAIADRTPEDVVGAERGRRVCLYWSVRARVHP